MKVSYRVYNGEYYVAVAHRLPNVLNSGALELRDEFGGPVFLVLASGQWTNVTREEEED